MFKAFKQKIRTLKNYCGSYLKNKRLLTESNTDSRVQERENIHYSFYMYLCRTEDWFIENVYKIQKKNFG